MTIEEQLNHFREQWHGIHCTQYDESLVYKTVPGYSSSATHSANRLIEELNLNLKAEETTINSFIVKSNDNEKHKI